MQVLIKLGYPLESVDRAENGQIAVDKTLAHSYDVILMDVRRMMRETWLTRADPGALGDVRPG